MKKYEVVVFIGGSRVVEIEAENKADAEEQVSQLLEDRELLIPCEVREIAVYEMTEGVKRSRRRTKNEI